MHKPPHEIYQQLPWRSRGYLPHFDKPGQLQSITFRLADSLPAARLLELKTAIPEPQVAERREAVEALLDEGCGECWLRRQDIAQLVEDALLHFDGERYRTLAWCVLPNHVHWLMETLDQFDLGKVMQSVKGFTGKMANRTLGLSGPFWEREYHDRAIRDDQHLRSVVEYIHYNPVKAGLARRAEDWRWSSAWENRLGKLPL